MREIKFRIYDTKDGSWLGGCALHPDGYWTDVCGAELQNGVCVAYANWKRPEVVYE